MKLYMVLDYDMEICILPGIYFWASAFFVCLCFVLNTLPETPPLTTFGIVLKLYMVLDYHMETCILSIQVPGIYELANTFLYVRC